MKMTLLTCLILFAVAPFHAGDEATHGTGHEAERPAMPPEPTTEEIQAARAVVLDNPEDPDAHMKLAVLLSHAMRANPMINGARYGDEAVGALKKAIKLDPKRSDAYIGLAQFYLHAPLRAGGSITKAEELAHQLAEFDEEQGKKLLAQIEARKNGGSARAH